MVWQSPEGMDEYLKPTRLCDCDNVRVREKAKDIVNGAETPKEAALKIFYFVRDEILFGLDYPDAKASHTLRKQIGQCFTKSNLQIALLRAVGIPARCHYAHIASSELVKDITPRFMRSRMPRAMGHPWCECYLSEKWIACEALRDKALFEGRLKKGLIPKEQIPPTIDWDGETDFILSKPIIVEDVGTFPSSDEMLEFIAKEEKGKVSMPPKLPRVLISFVFSFPNWRINRMRKG